MNIPCIEWTGPKDKDGYGQVSTASVPTRRAHRLAWITEFGDIPDGMQVLHKCDNPGCFNPYHLFLGTNLENITDRVNKGRSASGEQNGNRKLTKEAAEEIKTSGKRLVDLQQKYGVSYSQVKRIRAGKYWLDAPRKTI